MGLERQEFLKNQKASWTQYLDRFEAHGSESYSGWGSNLAFTAPIREWLPRIIKRYGIKTMLDAPCGDLNWLQHVDLGHPAYIGWDVEPFIVERNRERFPQHTFHRVNLLEVKSVPKVDLILCRDFFIHLPNEYITLVLNKFRDSGSHYLATTTYPGISNDHECPLEGGEDGLLGYYCHPVNLEAEPFNLRGRLDAVRETLDVDEDTHELALFSLRGCDL
jgi:hypothetical protein